MTSSKQSDKIIPENNVQFSTLKKESLEKFTTQIAKGAGITFIGDFFGKVIYFVSHILIARLLGAELFGLYALGLVVFNIAQTLSMMGLSQGSLRYVSIHHGTWNPGRIKGTLIQSLGFPFIFGSIIGFILFFSAHSLANIFGHPELVNVIKVVSFGVPFSAAMMVSIAASRGFKKMQYFVYVKNIFHPIANIVLIMVFYWAGFRLLGAVSAWIIAGGLGLLLSIFFIAKEFPVFFQKKAYFETKKLLKFSAPLLFVGILQMIFMRTDILMLSYFRPSSEVGIYNAATQIIIPLVMFLMAFSSIFSPISADLYNKKKINELNNLLKITSKWTFLLTVPVFMIVIISTKEILSIYGSEFSTGWTALLILTIFYFLSVSIGPISQTLIMSGKQTIEFCNTLCSVVLNIILNLIFIPQLGMNGASLATGISMFCLQIARLIELLYFLKLCPISLKYTRVFNIIIVVTLFTLFLKSILPNINYLPSLFITVIFISSSFIGAVWLIGLDEEDKLVLNAVKIRIEELFRNRK